MSVYGTKIALWLKYIYQCLYSLVNPVKKSVLFYSMGGQQYSCNPRAISEKMHEIYPEYEIVWLLNKGSNMELVPQYVRVVSGRLSFWNEEATCFAVVSNNNFNAPKFKRKKQFYVQTWHGDRGFKKILYEAYIDGKRPIPVADNEVTDIAIAGSNKYYGTEMYRTAFRYYGDVIKIGCPRNDRLVLGGKDDEISKIKLGLSIDNNTKVLLFAPTFRDNLISKQNVIVDLKRALDVLSGNGEKWVCLLRSHLASRGLQYSVDERIIDVSGYPDMADLLLVTDFLITDYSSSCLDFALTGKPVILTIFDKEEYVNNSREFKVRPENVGFYVANNNDELVQILQGATLQDYLVRDKIALDYFETYETGNASETVCEAIHNFYIKNHEN